MSSSLDLSRFISPRARITAPITMAPPMIEAMMIPERLRVDLVSVYSYSEGNGGGGGTGAAGRAVTGSSADGAATSGETGGGVAAGSDTTGADGAGGGAGVDGEAFVGVEDGVNLHPQQSQ